MGQPAGAPGDHLVTLGGNSIGFLDRPKLGLDTQIEAANTRGKIWVGIWVLKPNFAWSKSPIELPPWSSTSWNDLIRTAGGCDVIVAVRSAE